MFQDCISDVTSSQDESSEEIIGEWMQTREIRDQIVVATKVSDLVHSTGEREFTDPTIVQYTTNFKGGAGDISQKTHYTGNNLKSMHISVEASLKKLRTDYIDILYVHWWDYSTSIEEVMNGLHNLVTQGKVLYLVSLVRLRTDCSWRDHSPARTGCFRYPRLGCVQGQHLRQTHREDAIRDISRRLEYP